MRPYHSPTLQAQIETGPPPDSPIEGRAAADSLSLHILWSACEPNRVGHSAECRAGSTLLLGRAPSPGPREDALPFREPRSAFAETTGHGTADTGLLGEALSRRQLELRREGDSLLVSNVGRCPMWINGAPKKHARVVPGDTIHLQQQLLLLCTLRRPLPAALRHYPLHRARAFGSPDTDGIVGESSAIWHCRDQLAATAQVDGHVLILGESGAGKELAARALHGLSRRHHKPFVPENIASIPAALGAALLFGNRRNFPNPGMEERTGLIGSAEGGTLFLDELGDLPPEVQPMLLRVMDRAGEYIRLGDESHLRRANVRFLGATNHPERLRVELRRRFQHEILVPSLNDRQEDIPLLARHVLWLQKTHHPESARFFREGHLRIDPRLLEQLVRHRYSTQVAELGFLLERALQESPGDVLMPLTRDPQSLRPARADLPPSPPSLTQAAALTARGSEASEPSSERALPAPEVAQGALDSAQGSVVRAAANLGITRHQLNRLIRRHQLSVNRA